MSQFIERHLLRLDSTAGLSVGVTVLALSGWLVHFWRMPIAVVHFIGVANVSYGLYGLLLLRRPLRPLFAVRLLAIANLCWVLVSAVLLSRVWDTASIFGIGHIVMEAAFVAVLGSLELTHSDRLARQSAD